MNQKDIKYIQLIQVYDEVIVNALDQYIRVKESEQEGLSVKNIKIDVDKETGMVSIYNDGEGISVDIHPKEKKYMPELIFGELLTSSNYNQKEIKHVGGKNGYGAKLANIFSKKFIIETVDRIKNKKFLMTFYDNKKRKDKPKLTNYKQKPYTKISYIADYERFKCDGLSDDMIMLMKKRAFDLCACTDSDVNVFFNESKMTVKILKIY